VISRRGSRIARRIACATVALCAAIAPARGQSKVPPTLAAPSPVAVRTPDDDLDILLVTFGLGQEVFERFGHNAIWVHDGRAGTDSTYDWGNFSFRQPGFLRRFLTGDTSYWMEGKDANAMVEFYRSIGRPITVQRLNLTSEQKRALRDFLRWNALEEHKYYRYDYYLDNCSTRLRDALDHVLGGALRAATDSVITPLSYRRESVRLTDGLRPVQTGIDIALGRPADAPLTVWQSFFIPMRLRDAIRDVGVPNGPGGARVPLVANERTIAPYPGTPVVVERATAPRLAWRLLAVGLVLAALVAGIRVMAVSRRGAAWGLALVTTTWSLACGLVGVILVLAWTATRHIFWAWNENLFVASPLSLALVVLLPAALLRQRATRAARIVSLAVVVLGVIGLLFALIPGGQENRAIVALFLPVHLAVAWSVHRPTIARAPG
jgi:hypothetical protein